MPVAILMPALSPTMTEGNVAKWLKKIGENVKSGDIIAEVETDKATMEVEAIDEGVLAKIIHNDGSENIPVNSLIGVISIDGETEKDIEAFLNNNNNEQSKNDIKTDEVQTTSNETEIDEINESKGSDLINREKQKVAQENKQISKISISPLAKRIANLNDININDISGTGPRGRIIKRDLDAFLKPIKDLDTNVFNEANVIKGQSSNKIPLTNIRKTIALRLQQSKQTVPHFYLKSKVSAEELIKAREVINFSQQNSDSKIKISYNDIIIKAVASALKVIPEMNRTWGDDSILQYKLVDISIAVATDDALFTPVIRSACQKSISEISSEMKDFIYKAKNNKLTPDDYSGGAFSISNLGMYNVHEFSAIINPPQSGILAIGEIFEEFKIVNDKVLPHKIINLVLSVDHRVADGAKAAIFLDKVKYFLENPIGMLV